MSEPTPVTHKQLEQLCKLGCMTATCAYLSNNGQFCCTKGTEMEPAIRERRLTMTAQGDNCSGPPDFTPTNPA
jgi:hypothetical protein